MKIMFLCGSLEPGHDGVGDYTRKLAVELIRQGNEVGAIALNDSSITEMILGIQSENSIEFPVLRIPSTYYKKNSFVYAKNWLENFNPDWISLQFVIFAFQPKGLPFRLARRLKELGKGRPWHIMFHELWVGMADNDTLKRKLWGGVQKRLVKGVIKELAPKVIHTQCDLFFEQLKKQKFKIKKLPLFSNIDVYNNGFHANDSLKLSSYNEPTIKFVFFGGLHPEAKLVELVLKLKEWENTFDLSSEFLYVGRNGKELVNHLNLLDEEKFKYTVYGERDPKNISFLLSGSTFGVSTGSPQMLEKSGTVASMIAHKIPVICIGKELMHKNIPEIKMLKGTYSLIDLTQLLSQQPVIVPVNLLSSVAHTFISDLQLG